MTLSDFIVEHSSDDTARLILNRSKWPDIDIDAAVTAIECRRKIRTKLPEWFSIPELVYPDRISSEQASSSFTALYKAAIAKQILSVEPTADNKNLRIADLTGGLGVDSLAFSRLVGQVLYNEMDSAKASAARHNFPLLGAENIVVTNLCVSEGSPFWQILRDFNPGLIFLDPARRSENGNKVFLLEDCSPDVLILLPEIFGITKNLLLKLSPMADITMLVNRLQIHGGKTKEVHVISSGGECKELLLWVVQDPDSHKNGRESRQENAHITTNLTDISDAYELIINENGQILRLTSDTESHSEPVLFNDEPDLLGSAFLFEPGKAISKAGIFNTLCSRFNLHKAGLFTHIYFKSGSEIPDSEIDSLKSFGKLYKILEVTKFNKQSVKEFSKKFPNAEVTAKNIPVKSEDLKGKLKCKSGGDIHIFGLKLDFTNSNSDNYIIATKKI